jgi:hypothetical protein
MIKLLPKVSRLTTFLYLFLITTQFVIGGYLASGREQPPMFVLLYFFAFLWIIGWWLRDDAKRREISWVYDSGFLLYVAWPLVMPSYLLKSRGAKGILVALAFIGVYIGATVLGMIVYLLLAPEGWPTAF